MLQPKEKIKKTVKILIVRIFIQEHTFKNQ